MPFLLFFYIMVFLEYNNVYILKITDVIFI